MTTLHSPSLRYTRPATTHTKISPSYLLDGVLSSPLAFLFHAFYLYIFCSHIRSCFLLKWTPSLKQGARCPSTLAISKSIPFLSSSSFKMQLTNQSSTHSADRLDFPFVLLLYVPRLLYTSNSMFHALSKESIPPTHISSHRKKGGQESRWSSGPNCSPFFPAIVNV